MKWTNTENDNLKNKNGFSNYYYSDSGTDPDDTESARYSDGKLLKATKYQCPMKCEGEKTYEKSGRCPVCNMLMAPADSGFIYY